MDKIQKALHKLPKYQRTATLKILEDILAGNVATYDIKKLKGLKNVCRIRKGVVRIIFYLDGSITEIIGIETRATGTYKNKR